MNEMTNGTLENTNEMNGLSRDSVPPLMMIMMK
jgi:hypothetical protein